MVMEDVPYSHEWKYEILKEAGCPANVSMFPGFQVPTDDDDDDRDDDDDLIPEEIRDQCLNEDNTVDTKALAYEISTYFECGAALVVKVKEKTVFDRKYNWRTWTDEDAIELLRVKKLGDRFSDDTVDLSDFGYEVAAWGPFYIVAAGVPC
jgi:hypothetical protein